MKLTSKDQALLEEAYQQICENSIPCPCKQGKKCTKKDCKCKACQAQRDKQSSETEE